MSSLDNKKYAADKLREVKKRNKYIDLTCVVCKKTTHVHVNDPSKYVDLEYVCALCKQKQGGTHG